jgi:hypothetical protein
MDRQQHYNQRLRGSSLSERLVATWMLLSGKENFVMVYNKTITPDFEHRMDHVDAGDLRVNGRKVEVKHLSRSFDFGEWPFHRFFICNKNSFDRAEEKPDFYFVLNKQMNAAAVVDVQKTMQYWTVEKVSDKQRPGGDNYLAYNLPLEHILWQKIGDESLEPAYQMTFSKDMEIVSCGTV